MARKFIEVEFYGDKGPYTVSVGRFSSVESLKATWARYMEVYGNKYAGQLKDDRGQVITGICVKGYKILTPPPKSS